MGKTVTGAKFGVAKWMWTNRKIFQGTLTFQMRLKKRQR